MNSPRKSIISMYLVALVLRLLPILFTRGLGIGLDDMFQYDMLARSLASGNGFRWYAESDLNQLEPYVDFDLSSGAYDKGRGVETSFRAPLYPAFLALIYFLGGMDFGRFLAARLAQVILLGAPLAPLTYLAGRQILPDNERAARFAGWAVAVYPMLLLYPLGLGTENLFFVLLTCSVLALLRTQNQPTKAIFLLSGFLLGLTALTRSVILPFAGLATLWVWFVVKQRQGALLLGLTLIATILPWMIRNSLLHGKPTGIETSLGYNLYVGYHPLGTGTFVFGPSLDLVPILDDARRDELGTQRAMQFIQQNPERFIPLAASRLGHFFRLEMRVLIYFYSNNFFGNLPTPVLVVLGLIFGLPFAILSISAALGSTSLPRSPSSLLLLLLLLGYLLPHVFILSEERFHLALIPFLAITAAQFWTNGVHPGNSRPGKTILISLLVVLLLVINWTHQFSSDAERYEAVLGPEGNRSAFPY